MKLKNVLVLVFLTLTLVPIVIVSLLLYNSGLNLSKESYIRNLVESINVQVDYISQTIENNMISDYRFAQQNLKLAIDEDNTFNTAKDNLLSAFQSYLEDSQDKITVCILLDKENIPIYTIGENAILNKIKTQLPDLTKLNKQMVVEFELEQGVYSLGIITPIRNNQNIYLGSMISTYDKSYVFKIISSYYKIADTSTYICRKNGTIVNSRKPSNEKQNEMILQALDALTFTSEGTINMNVKNAPLLGYYKNIYNSPWYLVGFVDNKQIWAFTNQFVFVYIFIIIGVALVDIILSFYISKKVVQPINSLIQMMDEYQNNLNRNEQKYTNENGYYETQYLHTKFWCLMKTILLVQHNFEGIYQLYQSSDMDDTNIDIDVKEQTIFSNKKTFQNLIESLHVSEDACIVERFIQCFSPKDQIILTNMFENMRDEHLAVTCEAEIYTPHLNKKWFHTLVVPMYEDDRLSRLFIQLRDISNFKKQEYESIEQARRDALTGLYNRCGFVEHVKAVLQSENNSNFYGLLFIDMDYFKLVNDNFGHSKGDDLLCYVGKTISEIVQPDDIISRFGGDEFAVFLTRTSIDAINKIKADLNKRLVFPFHTETFDFAVSASIGISVWSCTTPNTFEELLQQADASMYQAKREFKHTGIR